MCEALLSRQRPHLRAASIEDYWTYLLIRDGALHEEAQALEHKTGYYQRLQARPVRARQSLTPAPTMAALADLLATQYRTQADRRLLALTVIYKFASHEAAGIRAAWLVTPSWERCRNLTDRITRYHLCEEFCHLRLFAEMFKVFALSVEWPLFSWPMRTAYGAFARCPNWLLTPIAFGSEVMADFSVLHQNRPPMRLSRRWAMKVHKTKEVFGLDFLNRHGYE
jgi:hypothetical protein